MADSDFPVFLHTLCGVSFIVEASFPFTQLIFPSFLALLFVSWLLENREQNCLDLVALLQIVWVNDDPVERQNPQTHSVASARFMNSRICSLRKAAAVR